MLTTPPSIVLLSETPATANVWREMLADEDWTFWPETASTSGDQRVKIVVTDSERKLGDLRSQNRLDENCGIVAIGIELTADVVFAGQPTGSELRLACRLLSEIVQLRRERHASQQKEQRLLEIAERDALTGLANRRAWDAELVRRAIRLSGEEQTVCLALFDLDHFKDINTKHGYAVADQVLQLAGRTLQSSVRSADFVARIGGDEFGALLSNLAPGSAEAVVDRIRRSIERALVHADTVVVTATAGLAAWKQGDDASIPFELADLNLRRGKAVGRNRTVASNELATPSKLQVRRTIE
jgi:diguanylate cyclase (GGDEF)-like protein